MRTRSIAYFLSVSLAAACGPTELGSGDLPFEDGAEGIGKADHNSLEITPVVASIDNDVLTRGGKAILTSADSWEEYMGSPAPADVDFDREWVAFYGAGIRNTGGYSAEILAVHNLPVLGGLVVETRHQSPGFDCIVTQAFTWPHAVVKFDIPEPTPTWATSDHTDETRRCGPDNSERLADLAVSLDAWEQAKSDNGNSYSYTREFFSFLGFSFETDFVVEDGVVVERHYKAQSGTNVVQWSEIGDEVGTHEGEGHRVALIDDLYEECKTEVLTQDEDENFMNLSFDENGLLQSCTYFPRNCADDCSRGPVISVIEL